MATAAVSGIVSQQTGGKFANGAMTGAFIHMFNAMGRNPYERAMNEGYNDPRKDLNTTIIPKIKSTVNSIKLYEKLSINPALKPVYKSIQYGRDLEIKRLDKTIKEY